MRTKIKIIGGKWGLLLLSLALLAPGACAPDKKAQEELQQEIKGLKAELKAVRQKMDKLETGQQEILKLLHNPPASPPVAAPPVAAASPATPEPMSLSQLIKDKDRLQGTRVTFKGMPGTVLVHRQMLIMRAPEGNVEVYFGSIPDPLTINRLTSTTLTQPLTVTGLVYLPPGAGGNLKINAEAIVF